MTAWSITSVDLSAAQVAGILELAGTASATDGVPPLSEPVLLHLRYDSSVPQPADAGADPDPRLGRDFVATVDGEIAAYAHLDAPEPVRASRSSSRRLFVSPAPSSPTWSASRTSSAGRALCGVSPAQLAPAGAVRCPPNTPVMVRIARI